MMGLGGGCELVERGGSVICTPKGGVDVPRGDGTNSTDGEGVWTLLMSLLLGAAIVENVPLWRLSIAASEWLGPLGERGNASQSRGGVAAESEATSGAEDSVNVRLRAGVDTPVGVDV